MTSESMSLPLDSGYLRRECPHCERQFKWHHGPTDDRPDDADEPSVYTCPYCGETAPPDAWWTPEQLELARQTMVGPALRHIADELRDATRRSGGFLTFDIKEDDPEPPTALHEPADMVVVTSPCHPWEPFKIADDWREPIHCLVCGDLFALE